MTLRLVITVFLLSSFSYADPVGSTFCNTKMSGNTIELDARVNEVFNFVRSLDPKLVSFQRIPKWNDFDQIEKNLEKLKALKKDLADRGELEQVTQMAIEVANEIKSDEKIKAILDEAKISPPTTAYLPTQYELSRLYEKLLYSFNKELPKELRLPIKRLPYDQRHDQLLVQARELLKKQEARFDAQFSNTGFKNITQFKEALNQYAEAKDLYR